MATPALTRDEVMVAAQVVVSSAAASAQQTARGQIIYDGALAEVTAKCEDGTPQGSANHALVRLFGYYWDADDETQGSRFALQNSGALAILAPYIVYRAAKFEDD